MQNRAGSRLKTCRYARSVPGLSRPAHGCHGSALNMLSGRISAFPCRHAANNRCGALPGIPTKTVRKAYAARYPVPKPSADRTHRSEIPRRSTAPPPGDPRKAFANLNPNTLPRKRILLFGMTFFLCIRRRAGLRRESESTVRKTHAECAKSVGKTPDINISSQIFTPNAAPDRTASSESGIYSIRAFPYCKIRQSML